MSDFDIDSPIKPPLYSNSTGSTPINTSTPRPQQQPTDGLFSYSDSVNSSLRGNTYLDIPNLISPDKVNVDQTSPSQANMPPTMTSKELSSFLELMKQVSPDNIKQIDLLIKALLAFNQVDMLENLVELLDKQNQSQADKAQVTELNKIIASMAAKMGPGFVTVLEKGQMLANTLKPEIASMIILRDQLNKLPLNESFILLSKYPKVLLRLQQLGTIIPEKIPSDGKLPMVQVQKILSQLTMKIDQGLANMPPQIGKNYLPIFTFFPKLSMMFDKIIMPEDIFLKKIFVFDSLNPVAMAVNASGVRPAMKEFIQQMLTIIVVNESLALLIKEKGGLDPSLQGSLVNFLGQHAAHLRELTKQALKEMGKRGAILGKLQKVLLSDIIPGFGLLYNVMLELRDQLSLKKVVHVLDQLEKFPSLDVELYGARAFVDVLQRKLSVDRGASTILARILEKIQVLEIDQQELEIVIETLMGMIQFLMNILAMVSKEELVRPRSQGLPPFVVG